MALVFRALSFGRTAVVRASRPSLSRSFTSGPKFTGAKGAWKSNTAVGVTVMTGLVGTVYFGTNKTARDEFLKSLSSMAVVTAARRDDDFKAKRTGNSPDKCNLKVASPCSKKKNDCQESQPNVISPIKTYSLFLWITLEPGADPCCVANSAVRIEEAIKAAENECSCDEICAGVGFGPNFVAQVMGAGCKNFCYRHRKGKNGDMPVTDGDIFVHAKCDNLGQLFDFCKHYMHCFPEDSILEFEDIYGFDYKNGRDISGFLDNQTNPCRPERLKEVAVECDTGGSYALTQKWVHDFCVVDDDPCVLEQYIGREMASGKELNNKAITSHVARMNGSTDKNAAPKWEIVRQSQSYGSFSEKAGTFFLAFSADPCVFDSLLDRMVGASTDGEHDDLMRMTRNVKGAYWYFPGVKELQQLRS